MDKLMDGGFKPEMLKSLLEGKNRDPTQLLKMFLRTGGNAELLEPMLKNVNMVK